MSKKKIILEQATRLFARKGFQNTSMAELSRVSRVASATIFYHFKTKEDLFLAILAATRDTIILESNRYLGKRRFANGLQMVEGALSFYLHLAGLMGERFLLLHRHYPYALAEVNPVCREHLEAIYTCLIDIFERGIIIGRQDGSIADLPPHKTAMIVFSLADGIVRFETYKLYDAGGLSSQLLVSCRRMLQSRSARS